ncbi:hypothetical protein ACT43E_20855 (plasmid) [Acinetobacter baumannii]
MDGYIALAQKVAALEYRLKLLNVIFALIYIYVFTAFRANPTALAVIFMAFVASFTLQLAFCWFEKQLDKASPKA